MSYCRFYHGRVLAWFATVAASLWLGRADAAGAPLSADEIIQQALVRAGKAPQKNGADYQYTKRTITEEFDSNGKVKDRQERLYNVVVESGLSYLRLIQVNGHDLPPDELKKAAEREREERRKLTDGKPGQKGDDRENFMTAELVERFKYTLVSTIMINSRPTYVLAFEPRSTNLPVHKMTDKFLNQMAGTVWIDTQDFEVTRAEIHLVSEVSLWGGIVGTLRHCRFTLDRVRLPDGAWLNGSSHGVFEGRKLLESMLVRTHSEATDFRPAALVLK